MSITGPGVGPVIAGIKGPVTDPSTQGGGLPDGSVLWTAVPRMAMWILARGADETLVDAQGVKSFLAVGGGLWIRNIPLGCPGANLQDTWYINLATGHDERSGATIGNALRTWEELAARLGDQELDGALTPLVQVFVSGSDSLFHLFQVRGRNNVLFGIIGSRTNTPGVVGTLTTYANWNNATKTQCTFSWSGLASTWTAGQFLALPSLGNVSVIAGKDIGAKTAVSSDAFDLDGWFDVAGAAVDFQGYDVNAFFGKSTIHPQGEMFMFFQDIQLGTNDPVDLHWISVTGSYPSQVTFTGCKLYGVDANNSAAAGIIGCYVVGWRNFARDLVLSTVHDSVGGAIYRGHEQSYGDLWDKVLFLGTPSIDPSAFVRIEGGASCYGGSGWSVEGALEIEGYFWGKGLDVGGWVLATYAGGSIKYLTAANIGAIGTPPTHLYRVNGSAFDTLPQVDANHLCGIIQHLP